MSRTDQLATLLGRTRLDRLAKLSWRGLLVLNYHRFGRPSAADDPDLYSCTPEDFAEQIRLLADRFEIVPAGSTEWQHGGPARRIAVTVDDGYADQMLAADILAAQGVPGTFFVTTGFVDEPHHAWWDEIAWLTREPVALPPSRWLPGGLRPASAARFRKAVNAAFKANAAGQGEEFLDALSGWTGRPRLAREKATDSWMTWDDVRKLRGLGMEVGAHSVTHPVLSTLSDLRQAEEVTTSITRLRAELDEPVDLFAYPVGAKVSFDERTRAVMTENGIRRAFSFYGGVNPRGGGHDRFDIARAGVFA
ncbi:MAG: polysaccharide deacetylase family protein, partial [Pseudonocardia sp.]|nr:polysaccharide deacetylase family protein [Pseudonocardia sp.]